MESSNLLCRLPRSTSSQLSMQADLHPSKYLDLGLKDIKADHIKRSFPPSPTKVSTSFLQVSHQDLVISSVFCRNRADHHFCRCGKGFFHDLHPHQVPGSISRRYQTHLQAVPLCISQHLEILNVDRFFLTRRASRLTLNLHGYFCE
ncbi:hypothetical protein KSP39_PZI007378 [Platanthera zijinensis]|uniref:Uncharacterized protein n=1 Tax=Platanthera zijinensis TaxID=2320716 RepID=A0AAP0G9Y8_9ASPA